MAKGGCYFDMKRCPQCSFLYLDSDQICDLDQTPLVADDFETDPGKNGRSVQKGEARPAEGVTG